MAESECHKFASELEAKEVSQCWMKAMRRGDLEEAWRQTDRLELPRREAERSGIQQKPAPFHLLWNGAPFWNRHVVVYCNHGLGDTIQFVRFVPLLQTQARHVTVMAQPPLISLLQECGDFGEVLDGWATDAPPHDVAIEVMELPYALRLTVNQLAPEIPYLSVRPYLLPAPRRSRPQIGMVWASSAWDSSRSLPAAQLGRLSDLASLCDFHSFQHEIHSDPPSFFVGDNRGATTLLDTARELRSMDLFISVDTMAGHLAGAMGVPVWLLLKQAADWRWMKGDTTPWYPTMRLFRQLREDCWDDVIQSMSSELEMLATHLAVGRA